MSDVSGNRGVALNEHAIESLEFIRTTMARSAPFTAVSGAGGIAMGVLALIAAALARSTTSNEQWLTIWVGCAALAVPVGFMLMRSKARRHELTLWSAAGRRFAQGFVPSIAAGAVLTFALVQADAQRLPFADASFDVVTIAFGLRNLENAGEGLAEILRVLKPGGRAAVLEFSRPVVPIFRQAFEFYFHRILPRIGAFISGSKDAYTYLPRSVRDFPDQKKLAEIMQECGYVDVRYHNLSGGIAALHLGERL